MKKLNKDLNRKRQTVEVYNLYYSCSCDCSIFCKSESGTSYRSFKGLQGYTRNSEL